MINIRILKRPTKRSGNPLAPGDNTKVRGIVITNTTARTVYVDKFTPKKPRKKK